MDSWCHHSCCLDLQGSDGDDSYDGEDDEYEDAPEYEEHQELSDSQESFSSYSSSQYGTDNFDGSQDSDPSSMNSYYNSSEEPNQNHYQSAELYHYQPQENYYNENDYYNYTSENSGYYDQTESYNYNSENSGYYDQTESYYDSSSSQYYSSSGQDVVTTPDQWYNECYDQLYSSYQQYSAPYQSTESQSPSYQPNPYYQTSQLPQTGSRNNANRNLKKIGREETLSSFYCESCDRSFPNDGKLQEHLSQHKVCGLEGCKFTAHEKVVQKHIKMHHETGLYRRIVSNSDTEKWRAERKKKYPSKENILARQKQQEEMISRGERLSFDRYRFNNTRGQPRSGGRGRGRGNSSRSPIVREIKQERERPAPTQWKPQFPHPIVEEIDLSVRGKLLKFPGTGFFKSEKEKVKEVMASSGALNILCEYGEESSEDEDVSDSVDKRNQAVESSSECNSEETAPNSGKCEPSAESLPDLGEEYTNSKCDNSLESSCMSNPDENDLGSDDSGPDEIPTEKRITDNPEEDMDTSKSDKKTEPRKRKRHHKSQDREIGKDDQAKKACVDSSQIVKDVESNSGAHTSNNPKRQRPPFNNRNRGPFQPRNQMRPRIPTLLEKLLAPDIQHERNVILQCVRYVVESKFLGVGQSSLATPSTC